MSNAVFPSLPGIGWDVVRSPIWSTIVQGTASGMETRASFYQTPLYRYDLKYEVLRAASAYTELQQLVGFFNARQGRFDTFLFTDPADNTVAAESFGTGDGTTTQFQLKRAFGGFTESVKDLNGAPQIFDNGVLKTVTTHYTISATGLVTFVTAPIAGHALTWTGSYYRRVRFDQDAADCSNFLYQLWSLGKLTLMSVKT